MGENIQEGEKSMKESFIKVKPCWFHHVESVFFQQRVPLGLKNGFDVSGIFATIHPCHSVPQEYCCLGTFV